ncbi:MAG: hypothetical protein ACRD4F_19585 [Candidatus Angelobacter sp.]
MEDIGYRDTRIPVARSRIDWKAIWGGVFVFMAIWSVFGALGLAIFASAASPNAAAPVLGMSIGIAIWSIILTIIAMYVAGRETGRLAGVTSRHDGLVHGLMMFGLSVVAMMVLVSIGGSALSGNTGVNGTAHSPYVLTVFADLGWAGFVALFLGWLSAMFGASSGVTHKAERTDTEVREIRPAA